MFKQIKQLASDIWKSLTNAESSNTDSKKLLIYDAIPGTPFKVTGNEEQGYIIVLGQYRLTEPTDTIEGAIDKLETEAWQIISRMVATYLHFDKHIPITTEDPTN